VEIVTPVVGARSSAGEVAAFSRAVAAALAAVVVVVVVLAVIVVAVGGASRRPTGTSRQGTPFTAPFFTVLQLSCDWD